MTRATALGAAVLAALGASRTSRATEPSLEGAASARANQPARSRALAYEAPADEALPAGLTMRAECLETDLSLRTIVVSGGVRIAYDRFVLTSPRLTLQRVGGHLDVEGRGRVGLCPCPNPPVAFGFARARLLPPADLLLFWPRLEVGGATVLAVPWLWLRAPTRVGLLAPRVAWRGGDGLLLGQGIHWPLTPGVSTSALDVTAAGYVQGGAELTAELRTPTSTARARWDRVRSDLVALDARGSLRQPDQGAVHWDADVIRGPRARSGTIELDEAARAHDRAEAGALIRFGPWMLGAEVAGLGARGSGEWLWGPRWGTSGSGPLGDAGAWHTRLALSSLHDARSTSFALAREEVGADSGARAGALRVRIGLLETASVGQESERVPARATAGTVMEPGASGVSPALDAVASVRASLSLPLARAFGARREPWLHTIEPQIALGAVMAHASGAPWSATGTLVPRGGGPLVLGGGGVETAWGPVFGRVGASVSLAAGAVASPDNLAGSARPFVRWRSYAAYDAVSFSSEGALLGGAPASGEVALARARLGAPRAARLNVGVASRRGASPELARAFGQLRGTEPSGSWLTEVGESGEVGLSLPIARALEAEWAAVEDLQARALLSTRGALTYSHPCKCLRVALTASERIGRSGADVVAVVDLAPP